MVVAGGSPPPVFAGVTLAKCYRRWLPVADVYQWFACGGGRAGCGGYLPRPFIRLTCVKKAVWTLSILLILSKDKNRKMII